MTDDYIPIVVFVSILGIIVLIGISMFAFIVYCSQPTVVNLNLDEHDPLIDPKLRQVMNNSNIKKNKKLKTKKQRNKHDDSPQHDYLHNNNSNILSNFPPTPLHHNYHSYQTGSQAIQTPIYPQEVFFGGYAPSLAGKSVHSLSQLTIPAHITTQPQVPQMYSQLPHHSSSFNGDPAYHTYQTTYQHPTTIQQYNRLFEFNHQHNHMVSPNPMHLIHSQLPLLQQHQARLGGVALSSYQNAQNSNPHPYNNIELLSPNSHGRQFTTLPNPALTANPSLSDYAGSTYSSNSTELMLNHTGRSGRAKHKTLPLDTNPDHQNDINGAKKMNKIQSFVNLHTSQQKSPRISDGDDGPQAHVKHSHKSKHHGKDAKNPSTKADENKNVDECKDPSSGIDSAAPSHGESVNTLNKRGRTQSVVETQNLSRVDVLPTIVSPQMSQHTANEIDTLINILSKHQTDDEVDTQMSVL